MVDFHNFETFDPNGPGLGNLFGQISPLRRRSASGPPATSALAAGRRRGAGVRLLPRRRLRRRPARSRTRPLLARGARARSSAASPRSSLSTLAARIGGTPYTSAKALEVAAPVLRWRSSRPGSRVRGAFPAYMTEKRHGRPVRALALRRILLRAGVLLAARPRQRPGRADHLLAGADRPAAADRRRLDPRPRPAPSCSRTNTASATSPGSCAAAGSASPTKTRRRRRSPPGVRFVITSGERTRAAFPGLTLREEADPYLLWARSGRSRAAVTAR